MKSKFFSLSTNPARVIALNFILVITSGALLLMLPFATRSGQMTGFSDALFTATSATCVTGLVVVDTYQYWSIFGQVVILLLIQIGGLSLVTLTLSFNILLRRKLGLRRLHLALESTGASGFEGAPRLLKGIVGISLAVEGFGALLLMPCFVPKYGGEGVFISFFLAVSSFCNAGFDILGREGAYSSVTHYGSSYILLVLAALIILGGLGFTVLYDLVAFRKDKKLRFHSRIVLIFSAILVVCGTLVLFLLEWGNPETVGGLPLWQKIYHSFFQSVSARTAGYNSVSISRMGDLSKLFMILLMFIGAGPASTGGGIKVTSFAVLIMTAVSVARGHEDTVLMKHKLSRQTVYRALTVAMIGILAIFVAGGVIYYTVHEHGAKVSPIDAVFEAASAFATVGLSTGISEIANLPSKLILIVTMFLGRIGPISLLLSLAANTRPNRKEIIPEGHLLVG